MLRTVYPAPCHHDGAGTVSFPPREVRFLHPGYPPNYQVLFILPAIDENGTLHHETARSVCVVVTGREDGFLSEDQEGQTRLQESTEARLNRDEYYFQVPGEEGLNIEYSVYPSFRQWSLSLIPQYWTECIILPRPPHPMPRANAMQVAMRDISCRVTQFKEVTEMAHIIPASETEWFISQGLSNIAELNHPSNAILLRSDIHKIFDSKCFTIVPKRSDQGCVLVVHIFERFCSEEVVKLYHNVQLQPLYGIKIEFLLARFAWTIFDSVKIFLERDVPRWLKLKGENGEVQDKLCSPQECHSYSSRSRSTSPLKRARATHPVTAEGNRAEQRQRSLSMSSSGSTTLSELASRERILEFSNQADRGRKRRRSFSPNLSTTGTSGSYPEPSTSEISETSSTGEEKKASIRQSLEVSKHVSGSINRDES